MRIRKLSIRNVKAIPELDIAFDERVSLLHGANGIGKSTILDCVALLGHLATMYRLVVEGGQAALAPPALHAFLRGRVDEDVTARMDALASPVPPGHAAVRRELAADGSIGRWFEDSYRRTPRVRYECDIDIDGITTVITFVVAMTGNMTGNAGLTVSHVLNRSRCDDVEMARHLLLMSEAGEGAHGPLDVFLAHQAATSTSMFTNARGEVTGMVTPDGTGLAGSAMQGFPMQGSAMKGAAMAGSAGSAGSPMQGSAGSPMQGSAGSPMQGSAGSAMKGNRVVAINTDLADLGKRDQIRESVKDITLDLSDEIARLNLPFDRPLDPDGRKLRFRFFDELHMIISRVIIDPSATKRENRLGPFLSLVSCDLVDGRPRIDLRRRDEEYSRGTDFMSAGENECFFVFLTLLGIDLHNSIVILDEPELHIAEYSRPIFFEELYALTKARDCQVITATHSLFAMPEQETFEFLVVDRVNEPGGRVRYTCGANPEYSLRLFKAYWRTGTLFLGTAGSARPFRALGGALVNTADRLGRARPLTMAFAVSVLSAAMCARGSDLLNIVDLQSGGVHLLVIRFIFGYGAIAVFVCFLMFWARRRGR